MTKRELKKYVEAQKSEVTQKVKNTYYTKRRELVETIVDESLVKLNANTKACWTWDSLDVHLNDMSKILNELTRYKDFSNNFICRGNGVHYLATRPANEELREYLIRMFTWHNYSSGVNEIYSKMESDHAFKIAGIEDTYDQILAVLKSLDAKKGIEYLKEIGIEVPEGAPAVTAVVAIVKPDTSLILSILKEGK